MRRTAGVLAAARRLAVAGHTLRLRQPGSTGEVPTAQLGALVDGIDIELGGVAARLRFGRVVRQHEPLRALHQALATELRDRTDPVSALLLVETDELVDATNTVTALLDQLPVD